MIRKFAFASAFALGVGCFLLPAAPAQAACTSYPNQLSNNTVADANQVMADFNCALLTGGGAMTGSLGLGTTPLANSLIGVWTAGDFFLSAAPADVAFNSRWSTSAQNWLNISSGPAGFIRISSDYGGTMYFTTAPNTGTAGATTQFTWPFWLTTSYVDVNTAIVFPHISTTSSSANAFLDVTNSNNLLRSTSSIRYKRDIQPITYEDARKVLELTPVSFHSMSSADDPNRVFEGLTAEQVAQYLPQFVNYIKDADGKEIPDGVQYDRVAAVALLAVVKEQQKEIAGLKSCRLWCMVKEAAGLKQIQ